MILNRGKTIKDKPNRRYRKIVAGVIALCLMAFTDVHALTLTLSGANVDVSYTEPATNALIADIPSSGGPLTDLSHTSIYYDLGAGPVKAADVPAALPTGGGLVNATISIPVTSGMERDVAVWATATDLSGNESDSSLTQTIRIDRLAPAPPE